VSIRKTVTEKQLTSNRHNGLRSNGPRTINGKRTSSKNALRHGLLSKEVVIDAGEGKENQAEFDELLRGLQQSLDPQSMHEELLVQKIATCYWRQRRSLRCEAGETRKRSDAASSDEVRRLEEEFNHSQKRSDYEYRHTARGIEHLLDIVEGVQWRLESKGVLSDTTMEKIQDAFGRGYRSPGLNCVVLNNRIKEAMQESNGGAAEKEEALRIGRKDLLEYLRDLESELRDQLKVVQSEENLKLAAHVKSVSLPDAEALKRILRYQTTIEREL